VNGAAYLDTSAFLRLFLDEPESEQVSRAVQEYEELYALRLVLTEARVSLERLRRDRRLSQEDHDRTMEALNLYWETQIQVVELSEDAYVSAEGMVSAQPGLRALDALHLGAARMLRKALRPAPVDFLSCDHRQRLAARSVQFATPMAPAD
jgi:hypothetical protein